jgi:hypothetical protein
MTRDQLIEHYLPAVAVWIKAFLRSSPNMRYLEDDFLAEANLQLIRLIDRYLQENKRFPEHFSHILRIVSRRAIATVQRLEYGRGRQNDPRVPPIRFFPTAVNDPEYKEKSVEWELLAACEDRIDAAIIGGLARGDTQIVIGERVGISRRVVAGRLAKIEARFYKARDEKSSL